MQFCVKLYINIGENISNLQANPYYCKLRILIPYFYWHDYQMINVYDFIFVFRTGFFKEEKKRACCILIFFSTELLFKTKL